MRLIIAVFFSIFSLFTNTHAAAGEADIVKASAKQNRNGTWRFSVTVRHNDEGWDHYADAWEILSVEREILTKRVLAHPHENEQPFTRSKSGIKIPQGTKKVIIRAHDNVHGYGGKELILELKKDSK